MKSKLVIVLAKFPEAWKVKTRLAKTIWFKKASDIQKLFIDEILKNNYFKHNNDYDINICISPSEQNTNFIKLFWVESHSIFSVDKWELWNVMSDIFKYWLTKYEEVILVGSDIPQINCIDFLEWFKVLKDNDIVLWPTFDWGYFLIWMKNNNTILFKDIVYSTETVLNETIKKCINNNLTYWLLEKKLDIDTYEDLILATKNDKSGFYSKLI